MPLGWSFRVIGAVPLVMLVLVPLTGCGDDGGQRSAGGDVPAAPTPAEELVVGSDAFTDEGAIPERYTCDAEDASPPLEWHQVPEEAAELAVVVSDPDAPDGSFVHWIVVGLDPGGGGLEEGTVPADAVEGTNDFGDQAYGGPCPPAGDPAHRYVFTVYAVEASLPIEPGATAERVYTALQDRALARGELVGTYSR